MASVEPSAGPEALNRSTTSAPSELAAEKGMRLGAFLAGTLCVLTAVTFVLRPMPEVVKVRGRITSWQEDTIRAGAAGEVSAVLVRDGQSVRAAQVLVRVNDGDARSLLVSQVAKVRMARIAQARLLRLGSWRERERTFSRVSLHARETAALALLRARLAEAGRNEDVESVVAMHERGQSVLLDQAIAQVQDVRAQLALLDVRGENASEDDAELLRSVVEVQAESLEMVRLTEKVARYQVTAPREGVFRTVEQEVATGMRVDAGQAIGIVAESERWRVRMTVNEQQAELIVAGLPARVRVLSRENLDETDLSAVVEKVGDTVLERRGELGEVNVMLVPHPAEADSLLRGRRWRIGASVEVTILVPSSVNVRSRMTRAFRRLFA